MHESSTMREEFEAVPQPLTPLAPPDQEDDVAALLEFQAGYTSLRAELAKVIVGQQEVIDQLLMAIFARSHAILVGVPGLAKTLLISTLAQTLHLSFKRIQFTPDLMPSDITGTEVMNQDPATGHRIFRFNRGPIFANIVLADEINRTPPKTQAAMLEAMQERKVTVMGQDYPLPSPFFVLATQNPLEQEGTYPLPEAQLDRFMFLIHVDYPTSAEEKLIMRRGTSPQIEKAAAVMTAEQILRFQQLVQRILVADHVIDYAERLVRATRTRLPEAAEVSKKWLSWGAGPRASLALVMAGKARAAMAGRGHISCEDVRSVAVAVLRHRIALNFAARGEGLTTDSVIAELLKLIKPATAEGK